MLCDAHANNTALVGHRASRGASRATRAPRGRERDPQARGRAVSRLVVCTSCGATIDENAALCECDRERLEQRIRARHLIATPSPSTLVRAIGTAVHVSVALRGDRAIPDGRDLLIGARAARGEHDA